VRAAPGRGLIALLGGLLAALASSSPATATPPFASAERVVLANGLVVILLPEPGSGLVSVGMMYRVGAKNEAAGTTGLAHYAEHMCFRATRRFPGHEITESVTRRGGRWTGYTWIDQTFYQTTMPKEDLLHALDLEADRMGGALYDAKEFDVERTSVVAELRSYDSPHSLLYDEVLSAAFQVHPYRNNTIGFLTDVEGVSRDTAFRFYERFYNPRNAVLVVGGDFSRERALSAVNERFASRPPGEEDAFVTTLEPPQAGERRLTVRKPGSHAEVLVAFRAPALRDPDFAAMVLFDALLAGGKGLWRLIDYEAPPDTPLEKALVASGVARSVQSAYQASLHPYVYTLRANTAGADALGGAEAGLFEALAAATTREWTEDDLQRARKQMRAGLARDLDTLAGRVHQLAFFEVAGGYEHLAGIATRLETTGVSDVRRFAQESLKRDQATIGWFVPTPGVPAFASGQAKRPDPRLEPSSPSRPTTFPPAVAPATAPSLAPTTKHLANGLTLRISRRDSTGLVALRGRVDAGPVHEASPGVAAVAARLFGLAAQEAGGPPLVLALDEEPARSTSARFLEFEATGLPEDLPALARAVAMAFRADPSRLEDARRAALEGAESADSDTDALLVARARAALFPASSPLARAPWGSAEALGRVSRSDVEAFGRRFIVPARTELSVAGPVDGRETSRIFEVAFAAVPSPRSASASRNDNPRLAALEPARGPAAWRVVPVARKDASQNTIHVVVAGDRSRPHDRGATALLLYLLGETYYAGRLGRALVEPGLVYSVWTTLEEPSGLPGYLLIQTAASKESTPEVLRRIREVLEGATRGGFGTAELEEAKTYLRGKAARRRDGATSATTLALEAETPRPAAQDVTLEQLNDTARRLFTRGAPLALVGGPGE